MLTDFQNSGTNRFTGKFAIKLLLNISLQLKGVATLPCDILKSENSNNLKRELWLMKKSQGTVTEHLRCGRQFSYHFTKYLSLSL